MTRRKRNIIVIVVAVLLAGAGFVVWFGYQVLQAPSEESRRLERSYVERWLGEQKKALSSGEQSGVHFYSTSSTDSLVRSFAGMPEIKKLTFELTDLTDEGVKTVAELPNIGELTLYGGSRRVGNAGLATLSQNQTLETLRLVNIDVTDDGLAVLRSLPRLKDLTIYRDGFREKLLTDKAVRDLRTLDKLERLNIGGGWMSKTAVAELRTSLPDCEVVEEDEW